MTLICLSWEGLAGLILGLSTLVSFNLLGLISFDHILFALGCIVLL
jgi:hypothetical protein